ncbi:hypothetical protein [Herbidospora sp. RD11066]
MDEEESLRRYGLRPTAGDLAEIRTLLREHIALERRSQGYGDTALMRLCCVQLFNRGTVDDALLIWTAKRASFDAGCSIDIHLLLGHGLDATMTYLATHPSPEAAAALARLREDEAHGYFDDFTVETASANEDGYYGRYS